MCSSTTCSLSPIIVVSQLTKDGFTPRDMRRWGKKADLKQNPQLAFERHKSVKGGSLEEKNFQDTKENLRKSKRLGIWG